MKASEAKVIGFVVVNEMGQLFQDPVVSQLSWFMQGYPGARPKIFDSTEMAQRVVEAYERKATIRPVVEGFPL